MSWWTSGAARSDGQGTARGAEASAFRQDVLLIPDSCLEPQEIGLRFPFTFEWLQCDGIGLVNKTVLTCREHRPDRTTRQRQIVVSAVLPDQAGGGVLLPRSVRDVMLPTAVAGLLVMPLVYQIFFGGFDWICLFGGAAMGAASGATFLGLLGRPSKSRGAI